MTKKNTPQTQKQFIDYRFNETNDNIQQVKDTLKEVQDQLNTSFASKDYVDQKHTDHEIRISSLEDDRKWMVRLVIGFVVLGVLAFFKFKGVG